jgi:hypothetical protein
VSNTRRPVARTSSATIGPDRRRVLLIVSLFLTAISLAVFGQTISYDFVNFDDDLYVYNAPVIKAGLTLNDATRT